MATKDYTITELTAAVKASFAQYDKQGTHHWTWQIAAQDLSYQIGSLQKIILQLSGSRWADDKDTNALEADFRDELADIMAEVLYIASLRGIDMNKAMEEMYASDKKKMSERVRKP